MNSRGYSGENLDLDQGHLHVRTVLALQEDTRKLTWAIRDYPKSDSGRRKIGLPAALVTTLRDHLDRTPETSLVFPGRRGGVLLYGNFRRRTWAPAVERAGLPPLTIHDARHSHVALLIHYGWPEYQIVRRLGWRDSGMLHSTYGHLFPAHDVALVAELDRDASERSPEGSRTSPRSVAGSSC